MEQNVFASDELWPEQGIQNKWDFKKNASVQGETVLSDGILSPNRAVVGCKVVRILPSRTK